MFLLFLLFFNSLFALIKEVDHFHELPKHASHDTIILVDIDDTLLAPVQMLGSDTWFEYRLKTYQTSGHNFEFSLEKTLAEWEAIRHLSRMQLVEAETSKILHSLQQNNIPIIGLTIQGLALATRTVLQLLEHSIDLSLTALHKDDQTFSFKGHTQLYRKGILFTSGRPKGESFFHFCQQIGTFPKRIIAIDDKLSHLQVLEQECAKRNIEFIGLRYGGSDQRKAAFSPEIAEYQLNHSTLLHLLSDEEAAEAISK